MSHSTELLTTVNEILEPKYLNGVWGKVALFSQPAPIEGRDNEDHCGVKLMEEYTLLVLADGMGGHRMGKCASKIAVEGLIEGWTRKEMDQPVEAVIQRIESVQIKIKALKVGAGSTVVVALIDHESVRFFNIGDSIAALVSGHKNIKFKTVEHSRAGLAQEVEGVSKAQLDDVEGHLLLNALGHDPLRIEVTAKIPLAEMDYVVLFSDGVTNNIQIEDCIEMLNQKLGGEPLQVIRTEVIKKMEEGGLLDDFSGILYSK